MDRQPEDDSEVFRLISRTLEILYPVSVLGLLPSSNHPWALLIAGITLQLLNAIISRATLSPRHSTAIRVPTNFIGLVLSIYFYGSSGFGWILGLPLVVGASALTPSRWKSPSPQRSGIIVAIVSSLAIAGIQALVWTPWEAIVAGFAGCIFTGVISIRVVAEFQKKHDLLRLHHQQVLKVRSSVERHSHLAVVGTMTAKIAHDINNPLTYVTMNMNMLKSDLANMELLDGEIEESITSTQHGITEITSIVRDLRANVTAEKRPKESVDLAQVGRDAVSYFLQAHPTTRLQHEIQDVPIISGEPHRLLQATLNLLMNSAEASSTQDDTIMLRIFQQGSNLIIEVEDNGPGIPESHLGMLFEPFYKTRHEGGGIGLGLAIVRTVVQEHSGKVECTSSETGGTTFKLTLPALPVEPTTNIEVKAHAGTLRGKTVLVIDDEDAICATIKRLLADNNVLTARSGDEGLEIIRAEPVDIILCDVIMPNVDGITVYETVRENYPELSRRFAFMTGSLFTPNIEEFFSRVDAPCLTKPFDRSQLIKAIQPLLPTESGESEGSPQS